MSINDIHELVSSFISERNEEKRLKDALFTDLCEFAKEVQRYLSVISQNSLKFESEGVTMNVTTDGFTFNGNIVRCDLDNFYKQFTEIIKRDIDLTIVYQKLL